MPPQECQKFIFLNRFKMCAFTSNGRVYWTIFSCLQYSFFPSRNIYWWFYFKTKTNFNVASHCVIKKIPQFLLLKKMDFVCHMWTEAVCSRWYQRVISSKFVASFQIPRASIRSQAFLLSTQKFTKPSYSIVLYNSVQCLSSFNLGFGAPSGSQSQHVTFTF